MSEQDSLSLKISPSPSLWSLLSERGCHALTRLHIPGQRQDQGEEGMRTNLGNDNAYIVALRIGAGRGV